MKEARSLTNLPERFARLYDYKAGKFESPLDSLGIADIDATFELAIRTYPEELPDFRRTEHDKHHLYWSEGWWKDYAYSQKNINDRFTVFHFRNSAPQVAYVPKIIHKWIEESQIPPPPPSLENMRRRNIAWQSASQLLSSAVALDKARQEYKEKKDKPRKVITDIPGVTSPNSRLPGEPNEFIEKVDNDYWLSELENRLDGWRYVAREIGSLSLGHGIINTPRLSDVRNLKRRLANNALIPEYPDVAA